MKIKLLAVPSIIALIIVLSIWVVYPAYSNGSTGVADNYKKLNAEQKKLDSMRSKSGNVSKFSSQLESMSSDKDVLYEFIPENVKESEIIDNLNKMAVDSNLLVLGIAIEQPVKEKNAVAEEEASFEVPPSADSAGGMAVQTSMSRSSALPKANAFATNMDVSGSYEQIKIFLAKVGSFARYTSVTSLSMKKQSESNSSSVMDEGGTTSSGTNSLDVSIKIEFNVLKKAVLSDGNVNDSVFSGESLDTKIISKIKDQYTNAALSLNIGEKGKSDIFQP